MAGGRRRPGARRALPGRGHRDAASSSRRSSTDGQGLRDGRQPGGLRRQPLLRRHPHETIVGRRLHHHLAAQPPRLPLTVGSRRSRPAAERLRPRPEGVDHAVDPVAEHAVDAHAQHASAAAARAARPRPARSGRSGGTAWSGRRVQSVWWRLTASTPCSASCAARRSGPSLMRVSRVESTSFTSGSSGRRSATTCQSVVAEPQAGEQVGRGLRAVCDHGRAGRGVLEVERRGGSPSRTSSRARPASGCGPELRRGAGRRGACAEEPAAPRRRGRAPPRRRRSARRRSPGRWRRGAGPAGTPPGCSRGRGPGPPGGRRRWGVEQGRQPLLHRSVILAAAHGGPVARPANRCRGRLPRLGPCSTSVAASCSSSSSSPSSS